MPGSWAARMRPERTDGLRRISYAWVAVIAMLALLATPAAGARKGPDLAVKALNVSGSPAAGQPFTATVTVTNAGQAKAKHSKTVFTLSRDAKASTDDRRL